MVHSIIIPVVNCGFMEACLRDPLAELPGYALRRAANAMMAELSTRSTTGGASAGGGLRVQP
jgi:hypothetical protein